MIPLPILISVSRADDGSARLLLRQALARDYEMLVLEWATDPDLLETAQAFPWEHFGKEPDSSDVPAEVWIFLSGLQRLVLIDPARPEGSIEGFVATSWASCADLPLTQLAGDLVYLEYIAGAPWNTSRPRRRFRIGPVLLDYSAAIAEAHGSCQLGLHALRNERLEQWYCREDLHDRGIDHIRFPHDPSRYFEGDRAWVIPRSTRFKAACTTGEV